MCCVLGKSCLADLLQVLHERERKGLPESSSISSTYVANSWQGRVGDKMGQLSKKAKNVGRF